MVAREELYRWRRGQDLGFRWWGAVDLEEAVGNLAAAAVDLGGLDGGGRQT
jgi:hypothetical protein